MWKKQGKPPGGKNIFRKPINFCLPLILLITLLLSAYWVVDVSAQEGGPQCPPGFVFDRRSGAGCVQEDCFAVGHYSYAGTCICTEGYSGCYEPIDYGGFDSELCHPFCPNSKLVSCIQSPQVCPVAVGVDSTLEESGDGYGPPIFTGSDFGRQVGDFISGPMATPPTPMRAAAGAMAATVLLSAWLGLDWLRDKDLLSDILKDLKLFGKSLLKPVVKDIKRQVAKKVGANLAANTANILNFLNNPEKTDGEKGKKIEKRSEEQIKTDKLADEFLKGGKTTGGGSTKKGGPQAKTSSPVNGKVINPKSRIFDGSDAMIILKELDMLPQSTTKDGKIPVTRGELDDYIGPALDGRPRKITLPNGRTIIVTNVEAILFEGEGDDKAVDWDSPKQIDFEKSVVITVELVEEAPTKTAPARKPAGVPTSGKPASGSTVPKSQQSIGQKTAQTPPIKSTGGKPPGQPSGKPGSGVVIQSASGGGGKLAPTGGSSGDQSQPTPQPEQVTYEDPRTGEKTLMDRERKGLMDEADQLLDDMEEKAIIEEADRLIREYDEAHPQSTPRRVQPSKTGKLDIIDGDEIKTATDDL